MAQKAEKILLKTIVGDVVRPGEVARPRLNPAVN